MKATSSSRLSLAVALTLTTSTFALADAKDELVAAAKKLGDAKNYSWTSTVDLEGMPFKPGPTNGKRVKDGYTWVAREMFGTKSEAYLLGEKGVTEIDGEWKLESELPQFGGPGGGPPGASPGGSPDRPGPGGGARGPNPGGGDPPNAGGPPGRGGPGGRPGGGARQFLQMQTKAPHEMALMFAEKSKDLKSTDGAITGELPEDLLKELTNFGRRGGRGGGPSNSKGWIKIKLNDGQITKAIMEIESEMRAPDGGTQTINAITTTEIKDVGVTQLDVPAAVKSKLEKAVK